MNIAPRFWYSSGQDVSSLSLTEEERHCLTMTLRMKLNSAAPGLTPREALRSLAAVQLVDVHIPITDGRMLIMPRCTEPETQQEMIPEKLNLRLPKQPLPRIRCGEVVPPKA